VGAKDKLLYIEGGKEMKRSEVNIGTIGELKGGGKGMANPIPVQADEGGELPPEERAT